MMDNNGTYLNLGQKLRQRLTQSQLRYIRLLEMTGPEVEEAVERELEENPALEKVETPAFEGRQEGMGAPAGFSTMRHNEPIQAEIPAEDTGASMYDELLDQLGQQQLPREVMQTAVFIIWSLDSNGYLRRSLRNILDDIEFSTGEQISESIGRRALQAVRELEPHGIGASDLRDCLLLQLEYMPESAARDNAVRILKEQYDAFTKKHLHTIVSGLHIPLSEAEEAYNLISTLNPKPGAGMGGASDSARYIMPDFIVTNEDGGLKVSLSNRLPELRIDESFTNAVRRMEENKDRRASEKEKKLILPYYTNAREFISILRQRQETLFAIMTAIVEFQKDYFLSGDLGKMRPMVIRDLAERTGYDISEISRATANKYVATEDGIRPLRFFFSNEVGDTGDGHTNRLLEQELRSLIQSEDKLHPLSDDALREALASKGINISRRTVAKYRDRLGIPVARLRRKI